MKVDMEMEGENLSYLLEKSLGNFWGPQEDSLPCASLYHFPQIYSIQCKKPERNIHNKLQIHI